MVAAVIIAVAIMMVAAGPISAFVDRHPTVKMLALSFLLLVGTALVAEGFDQHMPRGYIYFAMGFSVSGRDAESEGRKEVAAGSPQKQSSDANRRRSQSAPSNTPLKCCCRSRTCNSSYRPKTTSNPLGKSSASPHLWARICYDFRRIIK